MVLVELTFIENIVLAAPLPEGLMKPELTAFGPDGTQGAAKVDCETEWSPAKKWKLIVSPESFGQP